MKRDKEKELQLLKDHLNLVWVEPNGKVLRTIQAYEQEPPYTSRVRRIKVEARSLYRFRFGTHSFALAHLPKEARSPGYHVLETECGASCASGKTFEECIKSFKEKMEKHYHELDYKIYRFQVSEWEDNERWKLSPALLCLL